MMEFLSPILTLIYIGGSLTCSHDAPTSSMVHHAAEALSYAKHSLTPAWQAGQENPLRDSKKQDDHGGHWNTLQASRMRNSLRYWVAVMGRHQRTRHMMIMLSTLPGLSSDQPPLMGFSARRLCGATSMILSATFVPFPRTALCRFPNCLPAFFPTSTTSPSHVGTRCGKQSRSGRPFRRRHGAWKTMSIRERK